MRVWSFLVAVLLVAASHTCYAQSVESPRAPLEAWVARLESQLPQEATHFTPSKVAVARETVLAIDRWASQLALSLLDSDHGESFKTLESILAAKARTDEQFQRLMSLRGRFVDLSAKQQRSAIVSFLQTSASLIDLSGRLRYTLYDAVMDAAIVASEDPEATEQLIELVAKYRSSIGASVMLPLLSDNFAVEQNIQPLQLETKLKLLALAADVRQSDLVEPITTMLREDGLDPRLVVQAAVAIEAIGLPQDPRPDQDPQLPKPAITASALHAVLRRVDAAKLSEQNRTAHERLLRWSEARAKHGLQEDRYRFSGFDVQPGDWLLMRNPSPYNLFTDLSPGLFTHVGVVALENGADGKRRMVIADLPEKGNRMPATNVDLFVQRTLHYMFVRHPDQAVASKMGEVAASTLGMLTEFDLNFKTERLLELKGQPLDGRTLHTYCAGLLLLCAQETNAPRSDFFPIAEYPAGGKTVENLAKVGITFGENFVSPTGALFSPKLEIVGRREPMYDPRREVEEAVFDYFARSVNTKTLTPSPDWFQSLRAKVAAAAEISPALAAALARAADAPKQTDLASAARAAALIETLDEIAFGSSGDFLLARRAVAAGSLDELQSSTGSPAELEKLEQLRQQHASLVERWQSGELTPRGLRVLLVKYYVERGQKQLDERFFTAAD